MEQAKSAKLGRTALKEAAPAAARYTIWDSELKGFGLRVETTGAKSWVVRYRVGTGRHAPTKQFRIGDAAKLTPDKAREAAADILAQAELGGDPQGDRVAERKVLTVTQLCDLYIAEGMSVKKPMTVRLDTIRIERHIKPQIGAKKLTDLTASDIDRMRDAIATGKVKAEATAWTRGGKTAATKSVKLLRAIFVFAIGRKLCTENPAREVKVFADGKRDRFLSQAELSRLGDALNAAEAQGAEPGHIAIIRLLSLTGARKNEIACLRWTEVDLERGLLTLEDSKTGRKVIRLGAAAQELLTTVRRTKSVYVFPDPRDATLPIRNLDWAWVGIRKRAGLEDVRIHDLRHSFASVGVGGGASLYVVSKLLGHAQSATTQRYAHLSDDPVQAEADRISRAIAGAMSGKTPAPTDIKRGRR